MSGDSGLNELNRALGEVAAKVDGLRDQLADSDRRASEHRNRLYRRVEDIAVRTQDLEHRAKLNEAAIADMQPTVEEVRQWKQRGIGALAMAGFAGAGIGVALATLWDKVAMFFRS